MKTAYQVFLCIAYEPDQVFGTFATEEEANKYCDELKNERNMSHYADIEVGTMRVWDSVDEMKEQNARDIAEWERLNSNDRI